MRIGDKHFGNVNIYSDELSCANKNCCLNVNILMQSIYDIFVCFDLWVGRGLNYSRFRQDLVLYVIGVKLKKDLECVGECHFIFLALRFDLIFLFLVIVQHYQVISLCVRVNNSTFYFCLCTISHFVNKG